MPFRRIVSDEVVALALQFRARGEPGECGRADQFHADQRGLNIGSCGHLFQASVLEELACGDRRGSIEAEHRLVIREEDGVAGTSGQKPYTLVRLAAVFFET